MAGRHGLVVAIVGADGAGKSTVARAVPAALGLPARYVYLGVNLEASRLVLPTTWLLLQLKRLSGGRPDMGPGSLDARDQPRSAVKRARESVRLLNLIAEEWFRLLVVRTHTRRGRIVVTDRHFYADYHAYDVAERHRGPLARRLHGYVLHRWYPRPDLVVCLQAPAEVLWARKREAPQEEVAARQSGYLGLRDDVPSFEVVDADRPPAEVLADVVAIIRAAAT